LENGDVHETPYMTQKRELMDQVRKDKNYFYTYSEKYMSLSVDPYSVEEQRKTSRESTQGKVYHP
jgi:hypothetical protein